MGYDVRLSRNTKFRIPAAKVEDCLNGILDTTDKWLQGAVKDAKKHIKYFNHIPPLLKLIELVNNIWGFKLTPNKETNDIDKVEYELEKMHDFAGFCDAIAPYVESGSFLEFKGEDAAVWRYVFCDGTWKEVRPVITWPE
jgi:hypothetical protein